MLLSAEDATRRQDISWPSNCIYAWAGRANLYFQINRTSGTTLWMSIDGHTPSLNPLPFMCYSSRFKFRKLCRYSCQFLCHHSRLCSLLFWVVGMPHVWWDTRFVTLAAISDTFICALARRNEHLSPNSRLIHNTSSILCLWVIIFVTRFISETSDTCTGISAKKLGSSNAKDFKTDESFCISSVCCL